MIYDYRAYSEQYLYNAQNNLGNMLHYAVYSCQIDIDAFMNMFLSSGIAKQFGDGNPKFLTGLSGIELVQEIVLKVQGTQIMLQGGLSFDKSPEYWCGWALAFYQWYVCRDFKRILAAVPASKILLLYPVHHEADIEKFVNTMERLYIEAHGVSNLEQIRSASGLTIDELAYKVKMKPKHLYKLEKRKSDINRCDAITLFRLSRGLGCKIEDLLEI